MAAYRDEPEGLAALRARNLEEYGDENGGSPEFFFAKYGSWEAVIEKALSVNSGMDACLGLYDDFYDVYVASGQIPAAEQSCEPNAMRAETEVAGSQAMQGESVMQGEPVSTELPPAASSELPETGDEAPIILLIVACAGSGLFARVARDNIRRSSSSKHAAPPTRLCA